MYTRIPIFMLLTALAASTAHAKSELQQYVEQCQKELGFSASDVKPMNCNDGVNFTGTSSGIVNDYLLHQRVNSAVDMTVACRWLDSSKGTATAAASVEMLIHNRSNAETCFFSAKDTGVYPEPVTSPSAPRPVSTAIVSPTNFGAYPNANDYWLSPTDVNNKVLQGFDGDGSARCVGCHVAGPYIASPRIAPFLAHFGLLNDGHDTFADASNASKHYHAVGSSGTAPYDRLPTMTAFRQWDSLIAASKVQESCNRACHSIADNSTTGTLTPAGFRTPLLPSIQSDIALIKSADPSIMPPTADPYSDYRWINRDTPGGSGDWETVHDLQQEYGALSCTNPAVVQAHAVGSDNIISTENLAQIPDTLLFFNLREGLVCRNGDQANGHECHDYATRYFCNGAWTGWYDRDGGGGTGDWEQRSHFSLPCSNPTAIQARTTVTYNIATSGYAPLKVTKVFNGPDDRLRYFDTSTGLACVNDEQENGESCSNYVVRYICPN